MAQLSDSQAVVLGAACGRADRSVYPLTTKLLGAAATKVLGSLLKKGFIEEVRATRQDTVWREAKKKGRLTLRVTPAAFQALGIVEDEASAQREVEAKAETSTGSRRQRKTGKSKEKPSRTRVDSKQAQLIEMLKRPGGASIEEIAAAFGWRSHSVRGAIAGALKKKLGINVTSEKIEGRRTYRIAG